MNSVAHSLPTPTSPQAPSSGARLVASGGRALPLQHTHLSAEAAAGSCRVVLTQRFVNPHDEPLHVTYAMPLPADGAVSGFSFTVGETRVVGEVDTRRRARERFEQALATGHTTALLEQDRSALFTQEVGNVPPRTEIVCEVIVDQPLTWVTSADGQGAWEWRFPTVLAPRYQGAPGRVVDASKITVDVAPDGVDARASLAMRIGDAMRGALESPSHRVTAREGEVRFESARLDRDIVVRWPVSTREPGVSISCARPTRLDGETFGLLTIVPPQAGAMTPQARDLILLLDTSGSMSGRPLDQLKRVSLALLDSLSDQDRLEMIEFSSSTRRFRNEPIRATRDGKEAARAWLNSLNASGGTEMHRAVLEALHPLREDAQRQVVLMTDGFIGFEREIVETLMRQLPTGVRMHTVGVGSAPNRSLTEAAARAGKGRELLIGLEEDAERAAQRLVAATAAPLVTELRIEGARDVAPARMPDLFAGSPAMFSIAATPGTLIQVRGRAAQGEFVHNLRVPSLELGEGAIGVAARFARQQVEDLEMALSAGEPTHQIDPRIEEIGLRFQIATRLTSWIAVAQDIKVDPTRARRETQPHEVPEGVSMEGLGLRASSAGQSGVMALEEGRLETQTLTRSGVVDRGRLDDVRAVLDEFSSKTEMPAPGRAPTGAPQGRSDKRSIVERSRRSVSSSAGSGAGSDPGDTLEADELSDSTVERPADEMRRVETPPAGRDEGVAAPAHAKPSTERSTSSARSRSKAVRRAALLALFMIIAALLAALAWWMTSR